MTQLSQARVKSKGSKSKRKTSFVVKRCDFCDELYKGSRQSKFCSNYCVEQACRRRREALIEAFADLLLTRSQELTLSVYGVGFQITEAQAYSKAEQCIQRNHIPFKLKLEAIGYAYNDREKQWFLRAQLPPPLIQ